MEVGTVDGKIFYIKKEGLEYQSLTVLLLPRQDPEVFFIASEVLLVES